MQQLTDAIREDYHKQRLMDKIQWEQFPDRTMVKNIIAQLHEMVFFQVAETKLDEKVPKVYADLYSQLAKVCPKEIGRASCRERVL